MSTLFTIRLEMDGGSFNIDYPNLDAFLSDHGLKALFDEGQVTACSVYCGNKRMAGLPVMDWQRLHDQVIANSTAILRLRTP